MNYKHIYHAGNFADIIKHLAIIATIEYMQKKDKPISVLDIFAGKGFYDLSKEEPSRTMEYKTGIGLLDGKKPKHHIIKKLLEVIDIVRKKRANNAIYPGSPCVIAEMLRTNDEVICSELHPLEYKELRYNMYKYPNAHVHHSDAYKILNALLPTKNSRSLIVIDPPFEVKNEYDLIIDGIQTISKKMQHSVVMIWYPIKNNNLVNGFYKKISELGYKEILKIEFEVSNLVGMNKCGILILNPPYILETMKDCMSDLTSNIFHNTKYFLEIL
jgi:23S rRNA (adenine2030-N6)-methyltransferase